MSDEVTHGARRPSAFEWGSDVAPNADDAAFDGEAEELDDELSAARGQVDEYLATLQRLQADFENYRKRVVRAADDAAARATGDLVTTLLPVLDTLDLALAHFADAPDTEERAALIQARAQLLDTLAKGGLERIDEEGAAFDPVVHDAVAHEAGDGEQVIDGVLRAGYRWKGTVLRPAMVRVKG